MPELTPEQQAALKERLKQLTPEQMKELVKKQCVFCRIASGEVPAAQVYEDANFMAFLDIKPANPGHMLVIPKEHFTVLPQIPDELDAAYFKLIKLLAATVFDVTGAEGVTIRQRNGEVAGQVVPHVHVHIIPRFKNDGIVHDWTPKELTEEQTKEIQKRIIEKAKSIALEEKTPVYDIHGRPIEEKPGEKKTEEKKKEKVPKLKPRIP